MADFFKGLAGGFQTGIQLSEAMRRRQEYEEQQAEREQLRGIFTGQPTVTPGVAATPEQRSAAGLETGRLAMQDIADFGLSAQEAARYAPQMPSETATTTPTTYSYGGLTRQTPFSAAELNRMRMEQAIPVLAVRNPAQALQMQEGLLRSQRETAAAQRAEQLFPGQLAGQQQTLATGALALAAAQREDAKIRAFDTGWAELNKQEFDTPEAKANALVDLVARTRGPEAAAALRSSYTANQLNELNLKTTQLTQGFNEAFRKGPDAVMKWVDDQNPDFTLKRDGNNLNITYADGRTETQRFGSPAELMSYFAAQASPTNFLTFANNQAQRANEAERNAVLREAYGERTPAQKIARARDVMGRDLTDQEKAALLGFGNKPRDLSETDKMNLTSANRVLEERAKMGQPITEADRAAVYRSFNLNPADFGMSGLPPPRVGAGAERTAAQQPQPGLTRPTATQIAAREPAAEAPAAPGSAAALAQERAAAEQQRTVGLLGREQQRASAQGLVDQLLYRGLDASNINRFMTPAEARTFYSVYGEFLPSDIQRAMRAYAAGIR